MRSYLKIFLFLLAASLIMTLVFLFRLQPSIMIWEHYKVFFFSSEIQQSEIRSAIGDEALLEGIIFEDPEYHHSWVNKLIPNQSISSIRNFTMEYMRDFFFYDKSGDYRIIYVPEVKAQDIIKMLKKSGLSFGTDSLTKNPYLYPVVCFAVILLLMIFGRISLLHILSTTPLVLFTLWCPFYSAASGVICILFTLYTAEQYYGKKYSASRIIRNPIVIISFVFSLFSIAAGGLRLSLLFLATLIACVLLWSAVSDIDKLSLSAYHFHYVPILTSKNIDSYKRLVLPSVFVLAAGAITLTVFFFISAGVIKSTGGKDLYLPAPSEYTREEQINSASYTELKELDNREYPDTADFIDEYWLNTRLQYSKLSDSYSSEEITPGDVISFPFYKEDSDGIHRELRIIETFDDDFLEKIKLEFEENGGAEQFLAEQGKLFSTTYKKAEDTSQDYNSVLSIISLFVLFIILFILRLVKGCKK